MVSVSVSVAALCLCSRLRVAICVMGHRSMCICSRHGKEEKKAFATFLVVGNRCLFLFWAALRKQCEIARPDGRADQKQGGEQEIFNRRGKGRTERERRSHRARGSFQLHALSCLSVQFLTNRKRNRNSKNIGRARGAYATIDRVSDNVRSPTTLSLKEGDERDAEP